MIYWTIESPSDQEVFDIIKILLVVKKMAKPYLDSRKMMNEACTKVTGYSARDGYIRQRLMARKIMSRFCTKGNFNINLN